MFTRIFFISAAAVCLAGVLVMGGALAWQTADSARGAALVGTNGIEVHYEPNCPTPLPLPGDVVLPTEDGEVDAVPIACLTLIGPNGARALVGKGSATNTGDFALHVTDGSLRVTHVFNREDASDAVRRCAIDDFAGAVSITGVRDIGPGETGAEFSAFIRIDPSAPASCQGDVVLYKVTIEAENPLPPDPADIQPTSSP